MRIEVENAVRTPVHFVNHGGGDEVLVPARAADGAEHVERTEPGFQEVMAGVFEPLPRRLEVPSRGIAVDGIETLERSGQLQQAERRIELLTGVTPECDPIVAPLDDAVLSLDEKARQRSKRRTAASPEPPLEDDSDPEIG